MACIYRLVLNGHGNVPLVLAGSRLCSPRFFLSFFLGEGRGDRDRERTRKRREREDIERFAARESPPIGMPYSLNHSWLGHIERGECKRAIIVHSGRNPSLNIFFRSSLSALSFLPFHVLLTLSPPVAHVYLRETLLARPSKNSSLSRQT